MIVHGGVPHISVGESRKELFSSESGSLHVQGCSGSHQHSLASSKSASYRLTAEESGKSVLNSKLYSYKLGWLLSSSCPYPCL